MQIVSNAWVSGASQYVKSLVQTPAAPVQAAAAPQAPLQKPPANDLEAIRSWIQAAPKQTDVARAVSQNPTGQGLVFRRRFQITDVVTVSESELRIVEEKAQRDKR